MTIGNLKATTTTKVTKTSVIKWMPAVSNFIALIFHVQVVKCWWVFLKFNSKGLYLSFKTKIVVLCSRDHLLNSVARSQQASKGVRQEEGKKGEESPSKPPNPVPSTPTPHGHTGYLLVCSRRAKSREKKARKTAWRLGREGRSLSLDALAHFSLSAFFSTCLRWPRAWHRLAIYLLKTWVLKVSTKVVYDYMQ